jgi:hypothetical protein
MEPIVDIQMRQVADMLKVYYHSHTETNSVVLSGQANHADADQGGTLVAGQCGTRPRLWSTTPQESYFPSPLLAS